MEPVEIDIRMTQNVTDESKKATTGINDISDATEKTNAAMDSMANSGKQAIAAAKAAVQEQVNLIKQIESDIKNIESQLSKAAPGNAKSSMIEELNSAKQALAEEKAALGDYSEKVDEAASSNVRLRTQVMNAKQALDEMAQAGLRGTDVYKEQQTVLGDLTARMNSANRQAHVLGDPEGGMHAVTQTVTGMSGAFTAGVGVMSLFAGENENLQKIQMRLQAVMAITIGLTQTAEMLNTNSYFTMKILIPAKEMLAAAELNVAGAMGISTVAAQVLMGTLTLGLSVAIGFAIALYEKWSTAQEKLAADTKEFNDKMADSASKPITQLELLSDKWNSLGNNMKEKQAFVDSNQESFKSLGVEINNVADAENLLVTNKEAFIESLMAKAKAAAGMDLAAEKYKEGLKKMAEADKLPDTVSTRNVLPGQGQFGGAYTTVEVKNLPKEDLKKEYADLIAEGDKFIKDSEKQTELQNSTLKSASIKTVGTLIAGSVAAIDASIAVKKQALAEATNPDDYNKIDASIKKLEARRDAITGGKTKTNNAPYDAAKAMQKLLLDVNDETNKLLVKQQEDSLKKRLDEIDLQKTEEVRKITERETAIIDAYNKSHKGNKGFKALSTKPGDIQASLTTIDPTDTKSVNDATLALDKAYQAKSEEATKQWGDKMVELAGELADRRVKIEDDWNKKMKEIDTQATSLETKASTETDPELKQKLLDQAAYLRAGSAADKVERDKRVSDVTLSYIEETEAYKLATNDQLNLGKKLNTELVEQIKARVAAEVAAGKLTQQDANKILTTVDKSQAGKVSGTLTDYVSTLDKLNKAKAKLAEDIKLGNSSEVVADTENVNNLTKSVETYGQKLQKTFQDASVYANEAVGLLNAISTTDGDAASSAAKSIGTIMSIAGNTVSALAKGDYVGAAIALITGTLTAIFTAEKAHQEALAAIAKAKADTQKEYNDLLMKQNELLEAAKSIFGTDALAQANAYAAQMGSYNTAKNSSVSNLSSATVQTGSHKTGLFGWGGEKADYSSLLSQYPQLVDAQGNLNQELAQSILDNQKLDATSKAALQSALDYSKDYADALANLQDYLNSVFGSLGGDLMTAITDNLNSSKDALDDFGDYVGKAVKKMLQDLAYSIYFSKMFNDLSDELTKIYSNASLTDADKEAQASDAIGNFYGGLDTKIAAAAKFYNDTAAAFQQKTGIDMSSDTTRTGTSAGIATASQDSIDELTGGVYAIRSSIADIRNFNKEQLLIQQTMSNQLSQLIDNTSYCRLLENINQLFADLNLKGIKIRV